MQCRKSGIAASAFLHGLLLSGVRAISLCHTLCGAAGASEVEELGDFEADTELEELEGLTSWEWSSSVLLRERSSSNPVCRTRDGVIRARYWRNSSKGGTAGTQRIVIVAIKPVARCLAR